MANNQPLSRDIGHPLARVDSHSLGLDISGKEERKNPSSLRSDSSSASNIQDASDVNLFGESEPNPSTAKHENRQKQVEFIQDIVADWNDLAAQHRLPAVKNITEKRQSAIIARAREMTSIYDFPNATLGFQDLFARIRGSPFLRGEVNGFRCDFDFAMRQEKFTMIMEGKYETGKAEPSNYGRR